jgi:hypothetical protein
MMTDAWQSAFGAGLNVAVDVPTAVVGNGLGNSVGGAVVAAGEQHVDGGHYSGFGPIDIAVNVPTVVAGNGVGNFIGGDALASGGQDVGSSGLHTSSPFGDVNVAVSTPTNVSGNGVGNYVGGDVTASGAQHVGAHELPAMFSGQGLGATGGFGATHADAVVSVDHAVIAAHH